MNEEPVKNPKKALDAICDPAPLTMAKVALLERIKSPLMFGVTDDSLQNIVALYAISDAVPASEILKASNDGSLEAKALDWANGFDSKEFMEKLAAGLDAITAFWKMLPRPESDGNPDGDTSKVDGPSKKGNASETASSPS